MQHKKKIPYTISKQLHNNNLRMNPNTFVTYKEFNNRCNILDKPSISDHRSLHLTQNLCIPSFLPLCERNLWTLLAKKKFLCFRFWRKKDGGLPNLSVFFLQIMNMIRLDIEIVVFGVRLWDNGCKELFIRKLLFV